MGIMRPHEWFMFIQYTCSVYVDSIIYKCTACTYNHSYIEFTLLPSLSPLSLSLSLSLIKCTYRNSCLTIAFIEVSSQQGNTKCIIYHLKNNPNNYTQPEQPAPEGLADLVLKTMYSNPTTNIFFSNPRNCIGHKHGTSICKSIYV